MNLKPKPFLILLLPIFFVLPAAKAAECKHRIIFLPQMHNIKELPGSQTSEAKNDKIAESQLKIANYFEHLSNVPVFSEQVGEDFTLDAVPKDEIPSLKKHFDQIFPDGLPEDPKALTDAQKEKLINHGGEFVQLVRGKIKKIHGVVKDPTSMKKIFESINRWYETQPSLDVPYPPEIGALVYGARERAALLKIQSYFSQNKGQRDVILIYGASHSFIFYPELFPSQCVFIPKEFQFDWKGRHRSGPEGF